MSIFRLVMQRISFALVVGCASFQTLTVLAADVSVTRFFSGHWQQPQQESQGLILQVIDQVDGSKKAVVYWFTFGADLDTAWYLGVGPVAGNHIDLVLYSAFGVGFMQDDAPGDVSVEEIGAMTLTFMNCNHGTASFDSPQEAIGSGEFPIKRLSSIYRSRCSGGISDDTPNNAKPVKLDVDLEPARNDINGSGKASFWERVDRSDFKVEAKGIPDGDYQLEVCDDVVGELSVTAGVGKAEYRSPEAEGKPLLSFDPRGCLIRLLDGSGAALTSGETVLAEQHGSHGGGMGHGNQKIEVAMDSTGFSQGGGGKASYDINGNNTEFEVEVEDVPAGFYPLYVDGIERGQVEVVQNGDRFRGKLKFTDPQKPNTELLDFDPRGTIVEIYSGLEVILETLFPDA